MFAFAHTLFAPSMALALVYLGFQLVMGLRAATLRDVLLVRLPSPWMHSASPPMFPERTGGSDRLGTPVLNLWACPMLVYKTLVGLNTRRICRGVRRGRQVGWRLTVRCTDCFRKMGAPVSEKG